MGLFDFFKKKEAAPQPIPQDIMTTRKREPVQIEGLDKITPNRYGNYMFPPVACFTVYGTNPKTNRKNKKVYTATSEADATQQAEAAGLVGPFEITQEPLEEATDSQAEYAKSLGLRLPKGACKTDASALLDRLENDDPKATPPGMLEYLAGKGWRGSALTGYNEALWQAYNNAGLDTREKVALYAYCVTKTEKGQQPGNLLTDHEKGRYFEFADEVMADQKLLASFEEWGSWKYCAEPERRSKIYQAAKGKFL